jgi:pimeloyl-ACP methyl ester carboxylesterase
VLGLHGWLDNVATFAPLLPLLADLQIFAIDLPGHGLSEHRPSGVRYHLLDYVPAALESADALKLGEFILMGHCMFLYQ